MIGTFCSDVVVRECLHSLFATTLFFPFSEENKTLIETAPSLFVDTSLTNGTGLCTKIQPYGTCISGANDVRPHEMRAQNGATISPGAYNTTVSWHMPLTNGSSLCTAPQPYGTCTFEQCIVLHPHDTHTVASLAHHIWAAHETFLWGQSPNVRFASATHARALHAHNKPWLLWKTRKGQRARTCANFHAVTKSAGP